MRCPRCGSDIPSSANRCPSCGATLDDTAATGTLTLPLQGSPAPQSLAPTSDEAPTVRSLAPSARSQDRDAPTGMPLPFSARSCSEDAPTGMPPPSSARSRDEDAPTGLGLRIADVGYDPDATIHSGASVGARASSTDDGPLEIGSAFSSRYHIIKLLGIGGMGAVYQAWDDELGVAVAIKVIRPEAVSDPSEAEEVQRQIGRAHV